MKDLLMLLCLLIETSVAEQESINQGADPPIHEKHIVITELSPQTIHLIRVQV